MAKVIHVHLTKPKDRGRGTGISAASLRYILCCRLNRWAQARVICFMQVFQGMGQL